MMDQFYVWRISGVTYLCLRDPNNPWYGAPLKRLHQPGAR